MEMQLLYTVVASVAVLFVGFFEFEAVRAHILERGEMWRLQDAQQIQRIWLVCVVLGRK